MLKINMEYRKGILFIRLKGELTKYTYKSLNNYLISVIKNQGIKYIVFNLAYINLIDNYGKASLKMIIDEVKKNHGRGLIAHSKIRFDNNFKIIDDELMAFNAIKI
jgi:anti-anti-sigma factor